MGYYAKLKHGSKEIDLTSGNYCVDDGFFPPSPSPNPLMTGGNMLNRYAGGKRVDRSFGDRTMNIPLNITGDSESETNNAVRRLVSFIERATNDSSDPLYFVFGESDAIPYEPRWGQQFKYYEIKDATQALSNLYKTTQSKYISVNIPLFVGPFALGKRQGVGSATGGVCERTWGTGDGISRGLRIPDARTNVVQNPIFGNSTWNTGWADGANLTDTENTDEEFVFMGKSSAKLYATDSSGNTYTTAVTLTAATWVVGFVVKKPDGSTVSSSDAALEYNSTALTETYTPVGDGWWIVWASVTGVAAERNLVLYPLINSTLYVGYAFAEAYTFPSLLTVGDMLDSSWSSTAHNSNSLRTAGRWRIPGTDFVNGSDFTIEIVWISDNANTFWATDKYILHDSSMFLAYDASDDDWYLTDGTNAIQTSSQDSWSAGDIRIFHIVGEKGRLELFVNGVSVASGSTFTPFTPAAYVYLGSDNAGANQTNGTYAGLTTWDIAASDAEVLARYTEINEHVSGGDGYGQRLNPIPWVWDNTGDLTFDGCTDADHDNHGVIGGIPGNVDAKTEWNIAHGGFAYKLWVGLSKIPIKYFSKHTSSYFIEAGVSADATASNDDRKEISMPTTLPRTSITITPPYPEIFDGTVHFFLRAKHSASAGDVSVGRYITTNNGYVQDEDVTCAFTTEWRLFYVGELSLRQPYNLYDALSITTGMNFGADYTTVGSLHIDFGEALLGDMLTVDLIGTDVPGGGGGAASPTNLYFLGKTGYYGTGASSRPEFIGDELHLTPDVYNMIIFYYGDDGGTHSLTPSIGLADIQITPRWSIL